MSTVSKFRAISLYIKYNFNRDQIRIEAFNSFIEALDNLFGHGHYMYDSLMNIIVPSGSDFVEIDEALTRELKKYPALKGMRFQLQVCPDMLVV